MWKDYLSPGCNLLGYHRAHGVNVDGFIVEKDTMKVR